MVMGDGKAFPSQSQSRSESHDHFRVPHMQPVQSDTFHVMIGGGTSYPPNGQTAAIHADPTIRVCWATTHDTRRNCIGT